MIFYRLHYNNKPPFVLEVFPSIQQANKISGLTNICFKGVVAIFTGLYWPVICGDYLQKAIKIRFFAGTWSNKDFCCTAVLSVGPEPTIVYKREWHGAPFLWLKIHRLLGGGFKYLLFSLLFGEDSHFDKHIFQRGWFNHQLATYRGPISPLVNHRRGPPAHNLYLKGKAGHESRRNFTEKKEKRSPLWATTSRGSHPSLTLGRTDLDVSENSDTPKSSILIGFSIINHPF